MRKGPVLTDLAVVDNARVAHPGLVAHEPADAELDLAEAALAAAVAADPSLPGRFLYARVDMAVADDGSPLVMELELVEPNLFLTHNRAGLTRFAHALCKRALGD